MHKRQITVAVVDDDASMLGSTRELLNADGFMTEIFASAEEFLASGVVPGDSIVLCWTLGLLAHLELNCEIIWRLAGPTIPVIFMTGFDDEAQHRQALKAGCVALFA